MKIRVTRNFMDRYETVLRMAGSEYEVTEARGHELIARGFAEEAAEQDEQGAETEAAQPKKAKNRAKRS